MKKETINDLFVSFEHGVLVMMPVIQAVVCLYNAQFPLTLAQPSLSIMYDRMKYKLTKEKSNV